MHAIAFRERCLLLTYQQNSKFSPKRWVKLTYIAVEIYKDTIIL